MYARPVTNFQGKQRYEAHSKKSYNAAMSKELTMHYIIFQSNFPPQTFKT